MEKKVTQVVAALIWDGDKFLICQRPAHKPRGLLWEFVGGKVEPGETREQALIRECREELAVTVSVGKVFMEVDHNYPDLNVHLTLFNAAIVDGTPQLLEHNDIRWITLSEIPQYAFCPADKTILERLRQKGFEIIDILPLHSQITLVIFCDPNTDKRGVQLLPVSLNTANVKLLYSALKMPEEPGEDAETVSIEVDSNLYHEALDWCKVRGITAEQLVRAFVYFCAEPKDTPLLKAWLRQAAVRNTIDVEKLSSITREELEQDVDAVLARVKSGDSPVLIRNDGKPDALIFDWEDYMSRFASLYTPEEIAEIETACRELKDTEET